MGPKTTLIAFLALWAVHQGSSYRLSAGEPAESKEEKEEDSGLSRKLDALSKVLEEPGSVRVVQTLLEPPADGPWKASDGTAKAADGSSPEIHYSEDLERLEFCWARRIAYDSELLEYNDRSGAASRVSAMHRRWREGSGGNQRGPAGEMPDPVVEIKGFTFAACTLDASRRAIVAVARGRLCAYEFDDYLGELLSVRRVEYEFASSADARGPATTMKDIVARVWNGRAETVAKDRWIALISGESTVYAILCVKGVHCFYEILLPPGSPPGIDKGIAFIGSWRRD